MHELITPAKYTPPTELRVEIFAASNVVYMCMQALLKVQNNVKMLLALFFLNAGSTSDAFLVISVPSPLSKH